MWSWTVSHSACLAGLITGISYYLEPDCCTRTVLGKLGMVIPSCWLGTIDCHPRVVPQTAVLLRLISVVHWWTYVSAGCLRIYPPPVQTVVVSTKADQEVCTGGGCIRTSANHPNAPTSMPVFTFIILKLHLASTYNLCLPKQCLQTPSKFPGHLDRQCPVLVWHTTSMHPRPLIKLHEADLEWLTQIVKWSSSPLSWVLHTSQSVLGTQAAWVSQLEERQLYFNSRLNFTSVLLLTLLTEWVYSFSLHKQMEKQLTHYHFILYVPTSISALYQYYWYGI